MSKSLQSRSKVSKAQGKAIVDDLIARGIVSAAGRAVIADGREFGAIREYYAPKMVSMYLEGVSYGEIGEKIAKEYLDAGGRNRKFHMSAAMVKRDVTDAVYRWREENGMEVDERIARELARLEDMERKINADYAEAKKPDAKSYASMLKSLMAGKGGMTYDQAKAVIARDLSNFAAGTDYQMARLQIQKQRLAILGIGVGAGARPGVGGGQQQNVVGGTVNNYNFGAVPMDVLKEVAGKMQDAAYAAGVVVDATGPSAAEVQGDVLPGSVAEGEAAGDAGE